MNANSLTLGQIKELGLPFGGLNLTTEIFTLQTYEHFCQLVERGLNKAIAEIERNRREFNSNNENQTTAHIVSMLAMIDLQATFDTSTSGHCDIVVRANEYQWLGEAKKDERGVSWVRDGFYQLCHRYQSGGPTDRCGGILIYCHNSNVSDFMKKWHADVVNTLQIETAPCPYNENAFYTYHDHPHTSMQITIRHMPVNLNFDPIK